MKPIIQKYYGTIDVENQEPDVVEIWMHQKNDPQVVQIERENVPELIKMLQSTLTQPT